MFAAPRFSWVVVVVRGGDGGGVRGVDGCARCWLENHSRDVRLQGSDGLFFFFVVPVCVFQTRTRRPRERRLVYLTLFVVTSLSVILWLTHPNYWAAECSVLMFLSM